MTAQIVAVRMSPGGTHPHHITHVKWLDRMNANVGSETTLEMVAWLEAGNWSDCVSNSGVLAVVEVVHMSNGGRYLRSVGDGTTSDNLLKLPRF